MIGKICSSGIIITIRTNTSEKAYKIASACITGGINIVEVTFSVPDAANVIKELVKANSNNADVIIGAGTVLDSETARIAISAGARYILTPYLEESTVKLCNKYDTACVPGAMTVREIGLAMELGVTLVKLFPANILTPKMIKAVRGPLPHVKLVPTGGITLENLSTWIKAGSAAVGIGNSLTKYAEYGQYDLLTSKCKDYIFEISESRKSIR